jgi:hypothetical protein
MRQLNVHSKEDNDSSLYSTIRETWTDPVDVKIWDLQTERESLEFANDRNGPSSFTRSQNAVWVALRGKALTARRSAVKWHGAGSIQRGFKSKFAGGVLPLIRPAESTGY